MTEINAFLRQQGNSSLIDTLYKTMASFVLNLYLTKIVQENQREWVVLFYDASNCFVTDIRDEILRNLAVQWVERDIVLSIAIAALVDDSYRQDMCSTVISKIVEYDSNEIQRREIKNTVENFWKKFNDDFQSLLESRSGISSSDDELESLSSIPDYISVE